MSVTTITWESSSPTMPPDAARSALSGSYRIPDYIVGSARFGFGSGAIDAWTGDKHAGFHRGEIHGLSSRGTSKRHWSLCTRVPGCFGNLVQGFGERAVKLLNTVGIRGYEDTLHAIKSWLLKMACHGVVFCGKITQNDSGFGVWRLWENVAALNSSSSFAHAQGPGAVGIGLGIDPTQQSSFSKIVEEMARINGFRTARGDHTDACYVFVSSGVRRRLLGRVA